DVLAAARPGRVVGRIRAVTAPPERVGEIDVMGRVGAVERAEAQPQDAAGRIRDALDDVALTVEVDAAQARLAVVVAGEGDGHGQQDAGPADLAGGSGRGYGGHAQFLVLSRSGFRAPGPGGVTSTTRPNSFPSPCTSFLHRDYCPKGQNKSSPE